MAKIILPKLTTVVGNFCKGVKIAHFSSEIIIGQLLWQFGNLLLVTLTQGITEERNIEGFISE